MDENRYRPVEEFPWYLVCCDGYLINSDTGAIIRGAKKKNGYVEVCCLDENGRPHYKLLHRLVATAFCENEGDKPEVNHIDGNKLNNSADNLEWCTRADNLRHAFATGLREQDVTPKKIYATNMETGERTTFHSIYQAARFLGISQGNICMACKGLRPYAGGYYWEYAE